MFKSKTRAAAKVTKKVVLAGNPNAGKTTLFNALTRSSLKTGNFHGVTTAPAQKTVGDITFVDVPGMYSFNGYTMEEASAREESKSADLIINVVDCLTLESSLDLTRRLIGLNKNVIVYLTKADRLKARGGKVDAAMLQKMLGVPVHLCTPAQLKSVIANDSVQYTEPDVKISLDKAYYGGKNSLNAAEKVFYNKFFALPFFVCTLVATFFFTFHPIMPGALLKGLLEMLICDKLAGAIDNLIVNPVLASFVTEGVIGGVGGVLSFLPQISILYLVLILLDESGVSSALSFVTDGLFEKVGLSGRAAFSLTAGLGCTAAAIATTRGYAEDSARRKTVAVLPLVPCGAKLPVFLTFLAPLFKNPFPAVCALYFSGVALAIIISAILKGKKEGLITEVTPVNLPRFTSVIKKLYFQVKSFIIKVTGVIFAFCIISWLLSHLNFTVGFCQPEESILGGISKLLCYLFYPMGIRDWRLAYAALTGFAAKENIAATVAMLVPEGLAIGLAPSMALCVFFLLCPACISAFAASVKEVGVKRTLIYNGIQLTAAFVAAYLTNFIVLLL